MTVRDGIYQQYQEGGEAYKTIKGGLMPQFVEFVEQTHFEKKSILDLGCGTGKYLVYLASIGFQITGIDSSSISVEMTKKILENKGNIIYSDIYTTDIEPNTFDLIISIKTIHHETKDEIKKIIHRIYEALMTHGKMFITLPSNENTNERKNFSDKQEIAPGTFIPLSGPEKGLPHSYFEKEEVQEICKEFKDLGIELDDKGQRIIIGEK